MMAREPRVYLLHIRDALVAITEYTKDGTRHGIGRSVLTRSWQVPHAARGGNARRPPTTGFTERDAPNNPDADAGA